MSNLCAKKAFDERNLSKKEERSDSTRERKIVDSQSILFYKTLFVYLKDNGFVHAQLTNLTYE